MISIETSVTGKCATFWPSCLCGVKYGVSESTALEKQVVVKLFRCEREASLLLSDTSWQCRPVEERREETLMDERKIRSREENQLASEGLQKTL